MRRVMWTAVAVNVTVSCLTRADSVIYQYEADVPPHHPSEGWIVANGGCEPPCSESNTDGLFKLFWDTGGDTTTYQYWISQTPKAPPSIWVEWRFRSTTEFPFNLYTCDARIWVYYLGSHEVVFLFGDAAISFDGGTAVTGLDINEFHTYRFESLDGIHYRISVDGSVFIDRPENDPIGISYIQFGGDGGCLLSDLPTTNEWSFIRYGTLAAGEQIVSSDPPAGYIDPEIYGPVDRFTVTFDSPNYVYIDEITVTATGGVDPPVVLQTRRGDEFAPDTVEIVLDRPLPADQETSFTFDDGAAINEVVYTLIEPPPIPTTSVWGFVTLGLLILLIATVAIRPRMILQFLHKHPG